MSLISVESRRWSVSEYRRLEEVGFFERERVELIRGKIVPMAPHDPLHSGTVENATSVFLALFGGEYVVRIQLPFSAHDNSEPEPDVLVLTREAARQFRVARQHPNRAELVVEVARTSLSYDRLEKLSLYAEAGVPEYWIINLINFTIEVYRSPARDAANPYGWSYGETEIIASDGYVIFHGTQVSATQLFSDLM